jgi:hypothetical protein
MGAGVLPLSIGPGPFLIFTLALLILKRFGPLTACPDCTEYRCRGWPLATIEDYQQHAADCLRVAQEIDDPASKALLLEMALVWVKLAERARPIKGDKSSVGGPMG